jgi:hypothetical protein
VLDVGSNPKFNHGSEDFYLKEKERKKTSTLHDSWTLFAEVISILNWLKEFTERLSLCTYM